MCWGFTVGSLGVFGVPSIHLVQGEFSGVRVEWRLQGLKKGKGSKGAATVTWVYWAPSGYRVYYDT